MKRLLSVLISAVLILGIFSACGAGAKSSAPAAAEPAMDMAKADVQMAEGAAAEVKASSEFGAAQYTGNAPRNTDAVKEEPKRNGGNSTAVTAAGSKVDNTANAILAQRKIIRNANVSIEVIDFDKAYGQINSLISGFGFVQESSIKNEKIYVDNKEKLLKRGIIVVRIDKDKFNQVLTGIEGLGLLLDESIKSDDVTDKFFDTESRLRLLRFEENRLEQYLNKIDDPDIIFKTESRLTDIRHEIESLTGTLKKWSDLIELSTITINISEKSPIPTKMPESVKPYGNRLLDGLKGSFSGVIRFCGEFVILVAKALPVLLLLGLILWAALIIYRKFYKNVRKIKIENKDNDIKM